MADSGSTAAEGGRNGGSTGGIFLVLQDVH